MTSDASCGKASSELRSESCSRGALLACNVECAHSLIKLAKNGVVISKALLCVAKVRLRQLGGLAELSSPAAQLGDLNVEVTIKSSRGLRACARRRRCRGREASEERQ